MIGELDRRVVLYSFTETQSASGMPTKSWSIYRTVWAFVEDGGGAETITAEAPTPKANLFFTIRYNSAITEKYRILYNSVKYNITHIEEIDRKRYLKLTAMKPDNE